MNYLPRSNIPMNLELVNLKLCSELKLRFSQMDTKIWQDFSVVWRSFVLFLESLNANKYLLAMILLRNISKDQLVILEITKGQIKPQADWRAVDSPKNDQTNNFSSFCFLPQKTKTNSFIRFLGESTACQSAFGFIWPLAPKSGSSGGLFDFVSHETEELW